MFYSEIGAATNQRRQFKNAISGSTIANSSFETGNDTERLAANAVAATAVAATITSLTGGGFIRSKQLISQYSLEELRAAYARSIA